ncbi:MAG: NAD(P)H-hydrate epimerase [Propionibacteriaceae bacterium]|jgi:hydroxyethylthiazole kinase-like uncharacterized protein yjeF|nr:NAD(P)H-hydrate epimerase [Propionibacteriaceae bacterium]
MKLIYQAEQVRAAERATGEELTSGRLMQRAAAALAREVTAELADRGRRVRGARILLVAGPGDNGGDGLFAAADLVQHGAQVWVWATNQQVHPAGWATLLAAGGRPVGADDALALVAQVDLVLDAVFGIGARPGLPPAVATLAEACAKRDLAVVSADLPSGLAADSGLTEGVSFRATRTVSFGAWKPCQIFHPARDQCGARRLIDIGLDLPNNVSVDRLTRENSTTSAAAAQSPMSVPSMGSDPRAGLQQPESANATQPSMPVPPAAVEFELRDLAAAWPWPEVMSDKYARGVAALDTGSAAYPGAAVLGVLGAIHTGAGFVRYAGPARSEVLAAAPNVVCTPAVGEADEVEAIAAVRADAWLVGSGWGDRPEAPQRLEAVLAHSRPTVIDADAIGWFRHRLVDRPEVEAPVLLTPHAGELARLLDVRRESVLADPVAAVRTASRRTGATVLLKGATQYIAAPDQAPVYVCFPGPAWTAQAGSGDVLAGIAVALLATGLPPLLAAGLAGSIQALTAVRHPGPYPPQALVRFLPEVIASLR